MNPVRRLFNKYDSLIGLFCVLLATLGLSLKAIFVKLIYLQAPGIDAISILALRFVVALPFFLLLLVFVSPTSEKTSFNRSHFIMFLLFGTLGFYLSAILDFSALAYIPAALERLILFLYPTFVVIITIFLRPQEVTRSVIIALIISYSGLIVVFIEQATQMTPNLMKGSLLVLGAAIVFSMYTVGSVSYIKKFGSIRFTTFAMVASTMATLMHAILIHGLDFLIQPLSTYMLILPMAIFSTVMPLILMAEGVKRMGASRASIISTTGPVITITLAVLILDEVFGFIQAVGGLMIILGVYFVAKRNKKTV